MPSDYQPVSAPERLWTLDVVRGAALLGILLMNIVLFGMPHDAYANPNAWGGRYGVNAWIFGVQWIFFEGKMRALFSMMFGAGILLFLDRARARHDSIEVAELFTRRMLWLMLFGILHAWLIWYGDIIYAYGLVGVFLLPARSGSPRALFLAAGSVLLLITLLQFGNAFNLHALQRAGGEEWAERWNELAPPGAELQEEVDAYRSGYVGAFKERAEVLREWHFVPIYLPFLGDFWALMLIGMALLKLGILQGDRPLAFYVRMALAGYAIGIPVHAISVYGMFSSNFHPPAVALVEAPNQIGRVSMALAHLAVIHIVLKKGWFDWLARRVAAVGQMALSNYIAQSVLCSLVFYRPGLGLMGQLERHELYYVVAAVWVVNLAWSHAWLARFRFGPLEWCWRSLTYWERQPMRRHIQPSVPAVIETGG